MTPKLRVRLGSGGRLDCGASTCPRPRLPGVVREIDDRVTPQGPNRIVLADGWTLARDGYWRLSNRARSSGSFRNGGALDVRRAELREWDSSTKVDAVQGRYPFAPVLIVCPTCQAPQAVDPDGIGVVLHEHVPHPDQSGCVWCTSSVIVDGRPDGVRTVVMRTSIG